MQRIGSLEGAEAFVSALRLLGEFRNSSGSLQGRRRWTSPGVLSEPHRSMFVAQQEGRSIRFVVVSNDTPIAWCTTQGQWVIPTGVYTPTSLRHQQKIRDALGAIHDARTVSHS